MNSTVGRPRKVTDAQLEIIKRWYEQRKTAKQLACELGISTRTLEYIIAHNFEYKTASREEHAAAVKARRTKLKRLTAHGW